MRPRRYFILRNLLGGIAVVWSFLSLFILPALLFLLHESGAWFVPVFGLGGWWSLFNALPWILISFTVIFNVLLAVLVKRFSFGYQWPLAYPPPWHRISHCRGKFYWHPDVGCTDIFYIARCAGRAISRRILSGHRNPFAE